MLNNLLKSNNAQDIEIMETKFIAFEKIVNFSDLFINFWVSTTFYEECFSTADIFLFDQSDLTEQAKKSIIKRAFWFDNLEDYTKSLTRYLEDGLFYQKSNDRIFLQKYIDWNRRDQIAQNTLKIIKEITK